MSTLPQALRPGDAVGIFSPSSPGARPYPDRFQVACSALSRSLQVSIRLPNSFEPDGDYTAGTPKARTEAFHELIADSTVRAIFTTFGGFNSSDMLTYLDRELLRANPKILVGYSDTTALLLGYQAITGVVTYYGPAVLPQFGEVPRPFDYTVDSLRRTLMNGVGGEVTDPGFWTNEFLDWSKEQGRSPRRLSAGTRRVLREGKGTGALFGGNLSTMNFVLGTPFAAIPDEPLVLFVEATGDEAQLNRYRRALMHLRNANVFERTAALLVGRSPDSTPIGGENLDKLLLLATEGHAFPIVVDLPFGHTDPMATLPIGIRAEVSCANGLAHITIVGRTAQTS